MKKHRFNEKHIEQGELHYYNDFARIHEVLHLDHDNEPMLRVYRNSPGAVQLQIRTFAPITGSLVSRARAKDRNMIANVSITVKELEEILTYAKRELANPQPLPVKDGESQ